jgi:hypothetical protein
METSSIIALGALGIAALTFVATQLAARRAGIESASERRIRELEQDLEHCVEDKVRLERRNIDIADENLRLLRKVVNPKDDG